MKHWREGKDSNVVISVDELKGLSGLRSHIVVRGRAENIGAATASGLPTLFAMEQGERQLCG